MLRLNSVNQFGKGEKLLEYFQPSTLHQQLRLEANTLLLSAPNWVKSSFSCFRSDSTFGKVVLKWEDNTTLTMTVSLKYFGIEELRI